jgi:uncharacterized protein YjiK
MRLTGTAMLIKTCTLVAFAFMSACQSSTSEHPDFDVVAEYSLPAELNETSGLYCPDADSIYSINDSGNAPVIYQLNESGEIIKQRSLQKNQDWESITGDDKFFYVGDIGNNKGKRNSVDIQVVDKKSESQKVVRTLKITYEGNDPDKNEYLKHDFDAEALVSIGTKLVLFSKSWKSQIARIYELNKSDKKQQVMAVKLLEGLPGVITGVDYDSRRKHFIIVGYNIVGFGNFSPFMALLDQDYNLMSSWLLSGFNQVEGVCVNPQGDVWISQESSVFSTHKLAKLRLH